MPDAKTETGIQPRLERILETGIFNARWLVAPMFTTPTSAAGSCRCTARVAAGAALR